jgi:hypothetical protein
MKILEQLYQNDVWLLCIAKNVTMIVIPQWLLLWNAQGFPTPPNSRSTA